MTVLCKETPRVTMVNKFPPGAKGLAASRWATAAEPTPPAKHSSTAKHSSPARRSTPTVLCKEVPRVTMVNQFPPGAKGLAASRWATPADSIPQTKPAPTKPATAKPAPAKPAPAAARVLCQEVTKVTMVNPFPPGAKGLAASRWA